MFFPRATILALVLFVSACGGLPRPFEGRPGATAMRLAQPPPARLVVTQPAEALLPDAAGAGYADAMAQALAVQEVPAITGNPRAGDWRLVLSAQAGAGVVTPMFTVLDAKGAQAGVEQGQPVPADAWSAGLPATYQSAANAAAPGIADLLSRIEAVNNASDPNSLVNRQARLRVPDVTGAPGDGNRQLARQMRSNLAGLGLLVEDGPPGTTDFTVSGDVKAVPIAGDMERIEIQWIVANASGDERGHILQLNEVKSGTLDRYWGDVAAVVAQEAATGVRDIVAQQSGKRAK